MKNNKRVRTFGHYTLVAGILSVGAACNKSADNIAQTNNAAQTAPNAPEGDKATPDPHAAFKNLNVEEAQTQLDAKTAVAVDANGKDTREQLGVIPGAILLSNYRTFELSELPADKATPLVFYCGSETCTAAPKAAERAKEAGYTNAQVMPAGIRGWAKAGKVTQRI